MVTTCEMPIGEADVEASAPAGKVALVGGRVVSLAGMSVKELQTLQWEQERLSAQAIMAYPKDSRERSLAIGQAYDTICTILAVQAADDGQPLVMGLDPRYVRLVLKLLRQQRAAGAYHPRLFEVGYGCGTLLAEVAGHGYPVGGIEVSEIMRAQAIAQLGGRHAASLLLGDLRSVGVESLAGRPSLIYWNDVLEHIPPDEVGEYVGHIYELLAPSGMLVTITPNWLLRPSDVTGDFCPWRTEARGLHLKEYRLSEVTRLLRQAGFRRIATPLLATRRRLISCGSGGRAVKQCIEPWLDRLNVRVARLVCRGLAMSVTIARK